MSRNLLIITQRVDAQDDLLGFFVEWIREFARHFDQVNVITLAQGTYDLPSNVSVHSLGKEKGNSKVTRAFKFYGYLFRLTPKSDGIFAHMSPAFAIAAWPASFLFGKKIVLWYLHRSVTARLKFAELICGNIATAAKESLNIKSPKIVETGHGIEVEKFRTQRDWTDKGPLKILSVGRISPIKNFETVIEAARILKGQNVDFEVKIAGRPVMKGDIRYAEHLKKITAAYGLQDRVKFVGLVPHSGIASLYKEADFYVGSLPKGGIDKAMLEAMASGEIVFTSNEVFMKYLGEHEVVFSHGNAQELAFKMMTMNSAAPAVKDKASRFFVESIKEHHSLKNAVARISRLYN